MIAVHRFGDVVCVAPHDLPRRVAELASARDAGEPFDAAWDLWAPDVAACFEPPEVALGTLESNRALYASAYLPGEG